MSRAPLALALVAALALPALAAPAAAKSSDPEYPPEFLALVPGWIAQAEALVEEEDRAQPWFAEAEAFLDRAREAQADGRLRVAMFDLETFTELLLSHQLDDASKAEGSDGERKTFIVRQTSGWRDDALRSWDAFRASLHGYDAQLRSLQSVEKAVYVGDLALTARLASQDYDLVAREFPKQAGVPFAYVIALVRASHTPLLALGWTQDLLDAAVKQEGLPPRVVEEPWANLTRAATTVPEGEAPVYLQELDEISIPIRQNNESLLSIAVALTEQRIGRANQMQTIFGDASTRGLDVVNDAARGMGRQLDNTTLEAPKGYGLLGVFTSDAIDRARLTREYVADEKADLGTVITAWSALEHATYATAAFASVSPIVPEPEEENEVSFGSVALVLGAAVAVALVARRR